MKVVVYDLTSVSALSQWAKRIGLISFTWPRCKWGAVRELWCIQISIILHQPTCAKPYLLHGYPSWGHKYSQHAKLLWKTIISRRRPTDAQRTHHYPTSIVTGCSHKGSKGDPIKCAGGKTITIFSMVPSSSLIACLWCDPMSNHTHTVHLRVLILCDPWCVFLLCESVAWLHNLATDLLLPPAHSAEIMWKHPIVGSHMGHGWYLGVEFNALWSCAKVLYKSDLIHLSLTFFTSTDITSKQDEKQFPAWHLYIPLFIHINNSYFQENTI